ncbi:MAG: class IV adenylate cyclase [Planctomycetaceae bacterium]
MPYEVELKFPIDDPQPVLVRLTQLGATPSETVRQADTYFNHPSRDFGQTDEALRIRSVAGRHCVTYKGPLIDNETKTRQEIELPFGDEPADREHLTEIFTSLGFRPVRTVFKSRRSFRLNWAGRPFVVCIDDVDGLGSFVELETSADEESLDAAREGVQRLAAQLGLENSERRSYLVLLLQQGRP